MQEVAGPIHRTYRSNDAKARRKDRKGKNEDTVKGRNT